jgi:hypothetical protein
VTPQNSRRYSVKQFNSIKKRLEFEFFAQV